MARFDNGSLILEEVYDNIGDAEAAVRAVLAERGGTDWDVAVAVRGATYERAWWSDSYGGFTHPCSDHPAQEADLETCFPDQRRVTVVNNLGSWMV